MPSQNLVSLLDGLDLDVEVISFVRYLLLGSEHLKDRCYNIFIFGFPASNPISGT